MTTGHLLAKALVVGSMLTAGCPVFAADVTPERLVNADREPQNWLMNHRTYDAQRYSPLDKMAPPVFLRRNLLDHRSL